MVDPNFANADQYTVLLSEGLVNGGAIPEPPVPALPSLGIAVLVLLLGASAFTLRRIAGERQ